MAAQFFQTESKSMKMSGMASMNSVLAVVGERTNCGDSQLSVFLLKDLFLFQECLAYVYLCTLHAHLMPEETRKQQIPRN